MWLLYLSMNGLFFFFVKIILKDFYVYIEIFIDKMIGEFWICFKIK